MTTRIDSPLTPADRELRALLDQGYPRFTMISGAGSGKTTSLVKALAHIVETRGDRLRRQGQQVACITYTEIAASEIYSDLAETPLAHVSTIHSFLWTVIRPFQNDIRAWVACDAHRIIDAERATAAKGGARRQRAEDRVARYEAILAELPKVMHFRYGTGRDYGRGVLGHHEILTMTPEMIITKPLLAKIIARRFPFILVDESQDTFARVVEALMHIADSQPDEFTLGFFGDPMQKIYLTGVGAIDVAAGEGKCWTSLAKPENFRSSLAVLEVINAIRKDAGDPLEQKSGLAVADQIDGEVTFVVLPTNEDRSETLHHTLGWLRSQSLAGAWEGEDGATAAKILVIAHRMAARRLGFGQLYDAFHSSRTLRDPFDEGTAWPLTPFRDLLPLVSAADVARHQLIPLLLKANPALRDRAAATGETKDLLVDLSSAVSSLAAVVHAGGQDCPSHSRLRGTD
jgi:DNA helicase-2/ATP-dependent DNA helicase PcrA